MSEMPSREGKPAPIESRRKIRFIDRIYYYFDLIIKISGELLRDAIFFAQRNIFAAATEILNLFFVFFINPFKQPRKLAYKILLGVPSIIIGLLIIVTLGPILFIVISIGGTLSGLFGFRNLYDYRFREQLAAWLPLLILILTLPFFAGDFLLYKLSYACCYILILVGFDFLYGQCGIISLGHAGFVLLGSYLTAFFFTGTFGVHIPYFLSMFLAATICFSFGILLGLPSLRVKDYYLVIITIAFGISVPQLFSSQLMAEYSGLAMGGLSVSAQTVPEPINWISVGTWNYFFIVTLTLFLTIFAYNIKHHSQIGRAFRAVKCDIEITAIFGVPGVTYKLLAFAISAFYASIGGSLMLYINGFVSPDSYSHNDSIDYLVASVIGGPGSILGSVAGGIFLTFERDLGTAIANIVTGGKFLTRLFYGVFMIIVVYFAPRGVIGEINYRLKTAFLKKPKRGAAYTSPSPDYDFLDANSMPIKEE